MKSIATSRAWTSFRHASARSMVARLSHRRGNYWPTLEGALDEIQRLNSGAWRIKGVLDRAKETGEVRLGTIEAIVDLMLNLALQPSYPEHDLEFTQLVLKGASMVEEPTLESTPEDRVEWALDLGAFTFNVVPAAGSEFNPQPGEVVRLYGMWGFGGTCRGIWVGSEKLFYTPPEDPFDGGGDSNS